ncbi:hypothetical protein DRJ17_07155 [Candidatus Woesearchaeota archaeon]|nr:MAG: hypothetical protein DRJ17_07155 [Candidatus Woesearchaeota archaeon]
MSKVRSGTESEVIWIGPSKCDELRAAREERLKNAWHILVSCRRFTDMYLIIGSDIDLFREALSCYQNGAFMAAILMCGVVLESLLYDLTSAIKGKVMCDRQGRIWSVELDNTVYNLKFGRVIEEAKKIKLINGKLEAKINDVRNLRNIVAHYAQRLRKELSKTLDRSKELELLVARKGWASDREAYNALEKTAKITRILIEKAHSILCESSI